MTSQDARGPTLRDTALRALRPVLAALVTGVADPPPAEQPWPGWLRWTRRLWIGRRPFGQVVAVLDLVIAALLVLGAVSELSTAVHRTDPGHPVFPFLLAGIGLAFPVVLRNWHPVAAWRLYIVAVWIVGQQHWLDTPYVSAGTLAGVLCLYSLAVRSPNGVAQGAGAVSIVGVLLLEPPTTILALSMIVGSLVVGHSVRERRATRRELAEQEKRHQEAEAVLFERQRIARELHDVVAHHMSVIAIQAEAAPYKAADVPDETRQDLSEIRTTALEALTELRRVLGVLRSEDGAETAPQPGLDRLEDLVANARGAGLTVEFKEAGEASELPPGYGLTIYRIAQEALSNAMRHAPESHVDVEVEHLAGAVRLSVVNGPARTRPGPPAGGGHGLIGMRERAGMLGGELRAEPTPDGGFAVVATLPIHSSDHSSKGAR